MKEGEVKIIGKISDESREEAKRGVVNGVEGEIEEILAMVNREVYHLERKKRGQKNKLNLVYQWSVYGIFNTITQILYLGSYFV